MTGAAEIHAGRPCRPCPCRPLLVGTIHAGRGGGRACARRLAPRAGPVRRGDSGCGGAGAPVTQTLRTGHGSCPAAGAAASGAWPRGLREARRAVWAWVSGWGWSRPHGTRPARRRCEPVWGVCVGGHSESSRLAGPAFRLGLATRNCDTGGVDSDCSSWGSEPQGPNPARDPSPAKIRRRPPGSRPALAPGKHGPT
jgi:hypothetical protein